MASIERVGHGANASPGQRGFTIIELLVVVAILAVLVGILLPALSRARASAWEVGSSNMQRQLILGLVAYGSDNDQWIPGVNTSSRNLADGASPSEIDDMNTRSSEPVQWGDWKTNALQGANLPVDREQRFYMLFEQYADPANPLRAVTYRGGGPGTTEMTEYIAEEKFENIRSPSFLMPMIWQLFGGTRDGGSQDGKLRGSDRSSWDDLKGILLAPENYAPRLDRIGHASLKIAIADGTRYLEDDGSADVQVSYSHGSWGSFTDRWPLKTTSTAWGRYGSGGDDDSPGANLEHCYRHGGRMDAAFWDGHVELLDPKESRNPVHWAPSKSTFTGTDGGLDPDSLEYFLDLFDPSTPPSQRRLP